MSTQERVHPAEQIKLSTQWLYIGTNELKRFLGVLDDAEMASVVTDQFLQTSVGMLIYPSMENTGMTLVRETTDRIRNAKIALKEIGLGDYLRLQHDFKGDRKIRLVPAEEYDHNVKVEQVVVGKPGKPQLLWGLKFGFTQKTENTL